MKNMGIADNITKMIALSKYSTKKIFFKKRIIISILILLLVTVIMGYAGSQNTNTLTTGAGLLESLILTFFMPAVCMIYGCSMITDEIEDKSISHVLTSPMERISAYIAYYISLVICLCVIIIAITTSGFLSFFVQQGFTEEAMTIYYTMLGLVIFGVFVYSSLFLFTSVIFNRPIYFGLFYAFIWEGFIGNIPGRIQKISISHYLRSIGSDQVKYFSVSDAAGVNLSIVTLIIVIIILILFGSIIFKTKEFP